MVKIKKYANAIERFLQGEKGQRFFNFAYSIGAAIIIWGALFMILHLPGGSTLLCLGMGTEIAMFILTAFDRPPKDFNWDDFYEHAGDYMNKGEGHYGEPAGYHDSHAYYGPTGYHESRSAERPIVHPQYTEGLEAISEQMRQLQETTKALTEMNAILLHSYESVNRSLNDIREMYEKSAAESGDYCNEMQRMTQNMRRLNSMYERMLGAMTLNIPTPEQKEREY